MALGLAVSAAAGGCGAAFSRPLSADLSPEVPSQEPSTDVEAPGGGLGQSEAIPFALRGRLFFLQNNAQALPDFSKLKSVGAIYTTTLNVTPRSFESGFPGVTDRFESFAIDYRGSFYVPTAHKYDFRLTSDDGSRLTIDDKVIIDNDGAHGARAVSGSAELTAGLHRLRVSYFQGPRPTIALVLEVAESGSPLTVFDTRRAEPVEVSHGPGKLGITLRSDLLFDDALADLKPDVESVLARIRSDLIEPRPVAKVVVEAHTDDGGDADASAALSQRRADAVSAWLHSHGVGQARLQAVGYGQRYPRAPNSSAENRAKNRRIEIVISDPSTLP